MSRKAWMLVALLTVALLALIVLPMAGMRWIPLNIAFSSGMEGEVFWQLRWPRSVAAFISGAGLAVCGMVFQALFRTPLATPFTLGVASGASFAAVLASFLGLTITLGETSFPGVFALLGALGTVLIVYGLARIKRNFSINTLLLAGVAINYCFASAVAFLQYASDLTNVFRILRLLMGGFEGVSEASLVELFPFVIVGLVTVALFVDDLNLLALGDDLAISRGVRVDRTRKILFLATSLCVGGIVSVCGPVGFVGMMAPHICRLLIGEDHRFLMPATLLAGGVLLAVCDTVARMVIAPAEIPVGIITALLGGPFFLWLLIKKEPETD